MRTLLISIFALCSFCCTAQPQVRWLSEVIDFGAFTEEQGPVTASFRGVNVGTEPLVVLEARANCGCTTPQYQQVAYAPGDTLSVDVTYDPQGRPGRFKKYVYVDTNTEPMRTKLTIKGVVIGSPATLAGRYPTEFGALRGQAPAALLGVAKKGHVKSVFYNTYNASTQAITPEFRDVPAWLEISATPPTVNPGEQCTLDFFVRPDKTPLYGVVADTISIVPDAGAPSYKLPVVVTIEEDFSTLSDKDLAKAPVVDLPNGRHLALTEADVAAQRDACNGADCRLTFTFPVRNNGKSPLLIRRLQCTEAGVDAAITTTKIGAGKTAQVTVTAPLPARTQGHPLSLRLTLITNDPTTPITTLRLTAPL